MSTIKVSCGNGLPSRHILPTGWGITGSLLAGQQQSFQLSVVVADLQSCPAVKVTNRCLVGKWKDEQQLACVASMSHMALDPLAT